MPPEGRDVPLFVGRGPEQGEGNVLALPVLRELVRRHDAVMTDELVARHYWMVQSEVRGPWGMAETVRMIMNRQSPVSQQISWTGPGFDDATDADLTEVLTRLFEIKSADGRKPYARFVSGLEQQADGSWRARAFYILGMASTASLYGPGGEYSRAPGGEKPFFEIWERAIDAIYARPMTDTGENVHVWSFLALDSEVDDEVNQTLPLVGVSFVLMVVVLGIFFRDWRDMSAAAAGLGLLMGWMFGTQAWLGYPATQISSMLPILLLALGVDFSFHGLHRWRMLAVEAGGHESARLAAGWGSIRALRPALGLATVTTMIAFRLFIHSGSRRMGTVGCHLYLRGISSARRVHRRPALGDVSQSTGSPGQTGSKDACIRRLAGTSSLGLYLRAVDRHCGSMGHWPARYRFRCS